MSWEIRPDLSVPPDPSSGDPSGPVERFRTRLGDSRGKDAAEWAVWGFTSKIFKGSTPSWSIPPSVRHTGEPAAPSTRSCANSPPKALSTSTCSTGTPLSTRRRSVPPDRSVKTDGESGEKPMRNPRVPGPLQWVRLLGPAPVASWRAPACFRLLRSRRAVPPGPVGNGRRVKTQERFVEGGSETATRPGTSWSQSVHHCSSEWKVPSRPSPTMENEDLDGGVFRHLVVFVAEKVLSLLAGELISPSQEVSASLRTSFAYVRSLFAWSPFRLVIKSTTYLPLWQLFHREHPKLVACGAATNKQNIDIQRVTALQFHAPPADPSCYPVERESRVLISPPPALNRGLARRTGCADSIRRSSSLVAVAREKWECSQHSLNMIVTRHSSELDLVAISFPLQFTCSLMIPQEPNTHVTNTKQQGSFADEQAKK